MRVAERGIKAPMHAYKLSHYKPLYGYIFEDYLTEELSIGDIVM